MNEPPIIIEEGRGPDIRDLNLDLGINRQAEGYSARLIITDVFDRQATSVFALSSRGNVPAPFSCFGRPPLPHRFPCDDGNDLTTNDMILEDRCTCEGTIPVPPCEGQIDNDGDGICADDDCNDNNPTVPTNPGTPCDDGNPNTIHDQIGIDGCSCTGLPNTIEIELQPCEGLSDNDRDGVCSDVDCNDNDPNVPTIPGTPCNDGNLNTINDQIGIDGCSCVGTPSIIEPPSIPSCLGIQNALYRELWQGVGGSTIADLKRHTTYPDNPTTSGIIIGGVIPEQIGNYYGQRIRGFIQVPQSGEYQFNITGDDDVDVFLSTSAEPSSQVKIAAVDGWTSLNQHDKYDRQTSERISLRAGQYYYLEILHKEGGGGDHVILFWKTPATIGSSEWVRVPGDRFWSYDCGDTSIMPCSIDADGDGICATDDCNDNDVSLGRRRIRGTPCDDGNFSTINDRISPDGCTCIGTPSIIEPPSVPSCVGIQNALYRELWQGVGGSTIADLKRHTTYPDNPTTSGTIIGGVIRNNLGNYYGQRIRGFIQAPQTGEYQFNIAGDDGVDVFLGTSAEPSSQRKIAEVDGWTSLNQHDKYDRQTSERISLTAGQYYYLEILHKEGGGGDHVTLFWKTPTTIGSSEWARVPGDRFWSYDCGDTSIIPCSIDADRDGICAADDCDDNDVSLGRRQTRGISCDDGDPNTENDRISGDGCSCVGTPITIAPPSVPSCLGTQNTLLREVWQGVGGSTIDDLEILANYPDNPTTSGTIIGGAISGDMGDDYGQRIRGFIQVVQSGEYQFNITGDDDVDVFLGTSAEPSSQVKIAEINGWTNPNQHNLYLEQTSDRISLTAGQYYYLEILHKEGGGGDHLTLFWKTPTTISSSEWVRVPGDRFWSYDCGDTSIMPCSIDADGDGVCFEEDCDDFDPSLGRIQIEGTLCDDGNPNTYEDRISKDGCSCRGLTTQALCGGQGGDADRDGICFAEDCDDFNPSVGRRQPPGTSCDDRNPNTINDQISVDGCSCIGTPSTIEPPSVSSCVGTQNALSREVWHGVGGSMITDLERHTDYPHSPTISGPIIGGTIPDNIGDYYGQRIRGFIQVPQSGEYQFNITGDDDVDVFLSTDANPNNRSRIIEINGWTSLNQHDKYDRQTSERISLRAGQYYYLEILHKEGIGGDHVTLFWKTPTTSSSSEWVRVPGDRFWSYDCAANDEPLIEESCGSDLTIAHGRGTIMINGLSTRPYSYTLFNEEGTLINSCFSDCRTPHVISGLTEASYILRVTDESNATLCFKVIEFPTNTNVGSGNRRAAHLSFEAFKSNREVDLQWLTNSGYKVKEFDVEHSLDGVHFTKLKTFSNQEWGADMAYHQMVDQEPIKGINYYRIKEIYADDSFEYTSTKAVTVDIDLGEYAMYPNPASNELFFNLKPFIGKEATIQIINTVGVLEKSITIDKIESEQFAVSLNDITNGIYLVLLKVDGMPLVNEKLVVHKLY